MRVESSLSRERRSEVAGPQRSILSMMLTIWCSSSTCSLT